MDVKSQLLFKPFPMVKSACRYPNVFRNDRPQELHKFKNFTIVRLEAITKFTHGMNFGAKKKNPKHVCHFLDESSHLSLSVCP